MDLLPTALDGHYLHPRFAAAWLRARRGEVAFVEACTARSTPGFLSALSSHGFDVAQVRWVIVTHAHLDHAGGAAALMRACPNATLLAHPRAARHLIDPSRLVAGVRAVYGDARFEALYGDVEPIDASRVRSLDDGAEVALGDVTLRAVHARGHANHHMIVVDPSASAVFTGDAFGLVYPALQRGGRLALASTSPTDFDHAAARDVVDRIAGLGVERACLTHYGDVTDLDVVAAQLRRWLDGSEALRREVVGRDRDAALSHVRGGLDAMLRDVARDAGVTLDGEGLALLELDLALNAQGIVHAAGRG